MTPGGWSAPLRLVPASQPGALLRRREGEFPPFLGLPPFLLYRKVTVMWSILITRNESTTVQEESFPYMSEVVSFLMNQLMGGHLTTVHSISIEQKKDTDDV